MWLSRVLPPRTPRPKERLSLAKPRSGAMNHRVSRAPPLGDDGPESAVDALAVTVADDDAGGGEAGLDERGGGAGALPPGGAAVSGGGGGGGRFGGCPVS